jgi:hypothetical protein
MVRVAQWGAVLFASAALAAADPGSDAGWAALKRCAQRDTDRDRHACVDQLMIDTGLLTPAAREQQQQRAFGLSPAAPPASPAPRPAQPKPPAVAPSQAATAVKPAPLQQEPAAPDRVEVEIAAVATTYDGKLIITTRDGAVWRQTESMNNPRLPEAGQTMSIRKGSLGAYLCTPPSKLTWRCARTR